MRWQRILRFAIAVFVVAFAALVVVSLRRGNTRAAEPPPVEPLAAKVLSEGGRGVSETMDKGKVARSIKFGHIVAYEDGRTRLSAGVTVVIPDKNGRQITITSQDADVMSPPGK